VVVWVPFGLQGGSHRLRRGSEVKLAYINPLEAFDKIKSSTLSAIKSHFPISGKNHSLELLDLRVEDNKDINDIKSQKEAKEQGRTWSVPIRANVAVKDKTGKILDTKEVTIGTLPKITNRSSYIVDGNERQISNQLRLKSGVYTMVKNNGVLEQQWNLEKGPRLYTYFDPATKKMSVEIGSSSIPIYPLMKVLNVDDDTLQKTLGKDILAANMSGRGVEKDTNTFITNSIHKTYKALFNKKAESDAAAIKAVVDTFKKTKLRPDSTEVTLGKPFDTVNGASLLAGAENILKISRGDKAPDNRDSLVFKDFYSVEDLLAERIERRNRKDIQDRILNRIDKDKKVSRILGPDSFGTPIQKFFKSPSLSEIPTQMNPVQFLVGARRTTIGGEGGVEDVHKIFEGARAVDPVAVGFLDPVHTPENPRIGTILQMGMGARKFGKEIKTRVYNVKTGALEYISPSQALNSVLAFGDQYSWRDGKPVPLSDSVKVTDKNGDFSIAKPKEVEYIIRSPKGMFEVSTNLIPFLQNDQGNRTSVAARQLEQAVSLVSREQPLVQVKGEGSATWEHALGRANAHVSGVDGIVTRVSKDAIHIKGDNGTPYKIHLYDDFPLNDNKSLLTSTPLVKTGDRVAKGQTVADTNFSKDGTLAIGTNLRVAYTPYLGYNFEDGIVISDSAAKKLRSEHMLREGITATNDVILDKKRFFAETAGQYSKEQAEKLDEAGVVKPGTVLKKGDVVIGALKREEWRPEQVMLSKFSKTLNKPVRPDPNVWDKDYDGHVTNVVRHGKETIVYIKAQKEAEIGDKLAGRHGNKGILTCHEAQVEVLTDQGWKFFKDLDRTEKICTRNQTTGDIEYQSPTGYIDEAHNGLMYRYEGRRLDLFCTPEHNHYVRTRRGQFKLESAEACFGLPCVHLRNGTWDAPDIEEITIPGRPDGYKLHKQFCEPKNYDADLFLEFFGFYVTEGCLGNGSHIHIAQTREIHAEIYGRIVDVLYGLGYEPCIEPTRISISDPRLHNWLRQFGLAKEKFIPREFLAASHRQLRILADAVFAGDGGVYYREKDNHTRHELFTSSKRLADDYQELALKVGCSANIKPQPGKYDTEYVVRWSFKDEVWTNNDKRFDNERWEHYEGRVYCVEVPNHIVYVRRNGIPVWSGNCILPDHEMPKTADGSHVEVIFNPTSVPCYDDETEFLTLDGWIKAPGINEHHVFATLNPKTFTIEFQRPEEVYHIPYKGRMYRVENQQLDMLVTPNHKQYTAKRGSSKLYGTLDLDDPELPSLFTLEEAQEIAGQPRRYLKAAKWNGKSELFYYIPPGSQSKTGPKLTRGINLSASQWAEFMGWYLSEGSAYFNQANYGYVISVAQDKEKNPEKYARIVTVMSALGLPLDETPQAVRVTHKGLYELLSEFGGARDKYIPKEILGMESVHLKLFLDALVAGDGSEIWNEETGHYGCRRYWTSSKRLADGVQEVAAKLGIAANIKRESRHGDDACWYVSLSGSRIAPWTNWSSATRLNQVEKWEDYDGVVHCATVPNGTLLVRRNGKAVFSGNTRINLGQVLETAAAKIARKTGKPYVVNNFDPDVPDYTRKLIKELKQHGISDTEILYDPNTNKPFSTDPVLTGEQYLLKLHHTAEKGISARSRGVYDVNNQPKKGPIGRAISMDAGGLYALLAHGARENILEMQTVKADKNADYWHALQSGESLPAPKVPFAFEKFKGYLNAMGVNVDKDGSRLKVSPMTDAQVLALSNGEMTKAGRAMRAKDLKPEKGSIFDEDITGTKVHNNTFVPGSKWGHFTLAERMPSPIFETPIRTLLGLESKDFHDVIDGKKDINGAVGPSAISNALSQIDVKKELENTLGQISNARQSSRSQLVKKAKYLKALDSLGMSPKDAYTIKYVPVIPPQMRPITVLPDGNLATDDLNDLYRGIAQTNEQLQDPKLGLIPRDIEGGKDSLTRELYDGLGALTLAGQTPVTSKRHKRGIAEIITGTEGPKLGFFQNKIIGKRQDLSMRGVIVPEINLGVDEVGIPETAAREVYKPFVQRRLTKLGRTPKEAADEIKENTQNARSALEDEMKERPLLLKRDPVLHKYGIQAYKPRIVKGSAVQIHPLATAGYNADFDGDKMSIIGFTILIEACYEPSMPHNGKLSIHRVVDLKNFPRINESAKTSRSGSIEYSVPDGIFVPAFIDGRFETLPVTKFHIHPDCEEWLVTTRHGREERCSSDHSLALLDPDSLKVVKAKPANAIGRCLPTLRSLVSATPIDAFSGLSFHGEDVEVILTYEAGWFLGATIGDGWVSKHSAGHKTVHLAHGNGGEEVQLEWKRHAASLSGNDHSYERTTSHKFHGYDCESVKTTVCSTALGTWLEPMIGKRAEYKHLPEQTLYTPLEFRRGLFAGLIDTDGTANWNQKGQFSLAYNTSSSRLAEEVLLLGLSLGLPGNITLTESSTSGKPHYVVHFSIRPVQDSRWIQLYHPAKAKAFEELWGGEQIDYGRNDFVPMTDAAREELLRHLREAGATLRVPKKNVEASSLYVVLNRKEPTVTRITVNNLNQIISQSSRSDYLKKWFTLALDTTIGWDLVESAEPTGRKVEMYDLTVPGAWTFTMADGAVVWDSAFVPVSPAAVREAFDMLPSRTLFSPSSGKLMLKPSQESLMGLYKLSKFGDTTTHKFKDVGEAARAANAGKIGNNDVITIQNIDITKKEHPDIFSKTAAAETKTTVGRLLITYSLPPEMRTKEMLTDPKFELDKKGLDNLLTSVARNSNPLEFSRSVDKLKNIGYRHSTGMSFGLNDVVSDTEYRDKVLQEARKKEKEIRDHEKLKDVRDRKITELYDKATEDVLGTARKRADRSKNRLYDWVKSEARGSWDQYHQMTVAPMQVVDSTGKKLPVPVDKSYSEGLDSAAYYASMYGARMGTIGRVKGTEEPGALTKQIMQASMNQLVTNDDCGTSKGIQLSVNDNNILDRYLAKDIHLGQRGGVDKGTIPKGTLITPAVVSRLKNNKVDELHVRSPLKCQEDGGICATCFGLNEVGHKHQKGVNIGVIATHALGEPMTQMAMNCNAAGNTVSVRKGGCILSMTFEQLWNSIDSFVDVDGGVETKVVEDLEIWDHDEFTLVSTIQRHMPEDEMLLVRLENGYAFFVQADHPNWARKTVPSCPYCAFDGPVQFVGHYKDSSKTFVRCRSCRKSFQITPEQYEEQQEVVVQTRNLEGLYLGTSMPPVPTNRVELPVSPYLLAMALSEGNVRRLHGTENPDEGAKQRHMTGTGLAWRVLGFVITQNPGEIRDQIKFELSTKGFEFSEPDTKHIQINDVKIGKQLWRLCGIGSSHKALPPGSMGLAQRERLELLAGFLDGDGTSTETKHPVFYSTSWALASQIQDLVRSVGGSSTVSRGTEREIEKHPCFVVTAHLPLQLPSVKQHRVSLPSEIYSGGSYSRVKSVTAVPYANWTYDVSTTSRSFTACGIRTHNSFHTGGISSAVGSKARTEFLRASELVKFPKILPGSAILSEANGKVEKVVKDKTTGGHRITIGGVDHFVPAMKGTPIVRIGSEVKRGDSLSEGPKNPNELLPLTDINTVQRYVTDELSKLYRGGSTLHRRNTETVVRSLTNIAKVTNPGDNNDVFVGDSMPITKINEYNKNLKPGQKPIEYKPILKSVDYIPLEIQTDWLARLQSRDLKRTILDAAAEGWTSEIHGPHPIPGMAVGTQFGKGTKDKPWLY